jgi:hypothetical protein
VLPDPTFATIFQPALKARDLEFQNQPVNPRQGGVAVHDQLCGHDGVTADDSRFALSDCVSIHLHRLADHARDPKLFADEHRSVPTGFSQHCGMLAKKYNLARKLDRLV